MEQVYDAGSKYVVITDTFGYIPDIKTAEDVVKHFEIESTSKFTVFYNRADEGEFNFIPNSSHFVQ